MLCELCECNPLPTECALYFMHNNCLVHWAHTRLQCSCNVARALGGVASLVHFVVGHTNSLRRPIWLCVYVSREFSLELPKALAPSVSDNLFSCYYMLEVGRAARNWMVAVAICGLHGLRTALHYRASTPDCL